MQETHDTQDKLSTCTSISSQYADVSVPIKFRPYAIVGKPETKCCKEPVVSLHFVQDVDCSCKYEITITQAVCIRIPIEYGTTIDTGETTVNCQNNQNAGNQSRFGNR